MSSMKDMALALKRSREEEESVEKFVMANCVNIVKRNESLGQSSIYECRICKKQFDSSQALGGHRTSHKNVTGKLMAMCADNDSLPDIEPKKYKCCLCDQEFALGQALGGHMRKHRDELDPLEQDKKEEMTENYKSSGSVLLWDLNLTPHENELKVAKFYR